MHVEKSLLTHFERELSAAMSNSHANILTAKCFFRSNDEIWIILPLMYSLRSITYYGRRGLPEREIDIILKPPLKALSFLHERNKFHGNLKLSNVLIDLNALVQISDSVTSKSCYKYTKGKDIVPYWIAPECEGDKDNAADDIWSFGICALELFHGGPPLSSLPKSEILLQQIRERVEIPDRYKNYINKPRKLSNEFREMVESCLRTDPKTKPTAAELLSQPFFVKKRRKSEEFLIKMVKEFEGNINETNVSEWKFHGTSGLFGLGDVVDDITPQSDTEIGAGRGRVSQSQSPQTSTEPTLNNSDNNDDTLRQPDERGSLRSPGGVDDTRQIQLRSQTHTENNSDNSDDTLRQPDERGSLRSPGGVDDTRQIRVPSQTHTENNSDNRDDNSDDTRWRLVERDLLRSAGDVDDTGQIQVHSQTHTEINEGPSANEPSQILTEPIQANEGPSGQANEGPSGQENEGPSANEPSQILTESTQANEGPSGQANEGPQSQPSQLSDELIEIPRDCHGAGGISNDNGANDKGDGGSFSGETALEKKLLQVCKSKFKVTDNFTTNLKAVKGSLNIEIKKIDRIRRQLKTNAPGLDSRSIRSTHQTASKNKRFGGLLQDLSNCIDTQRKNVSDLTAILNDDKPNQKRELFQQQLVLLHKEEKIIQHVKTHLPS